MILFKPADVGYELLIWNHVFAVEFPTSSKRVLWVDGEPVHGYSYSVSGIINFLVANSSNRRLVNRMVSLLKAVSRLSYRIQHIWVETIFNKLEEFNRFYEDVATNKRYWKVRRLLRAANTKNIVEEDSNPENQEDLDGFLEVGGFESLKYGYKVFNGKETVKVLFTADSFGRVNSAEVEGVCTPLTYHKHLVQMLLKDGNPARLKVFMETLTYLKGKTQKKWVEKLWQAHQQKQTESFLNQKFKGKLGKLIKAAEVVEKGYHILNRNRVLLVSKRRPVCYQLTVESEEKIWIVETVSALTEVAKLLSKNKDVSRSYTSIALLPPEERGEIGRLLEQSPELERFRETFAVNAILTL
jgi:hypothetical protein